MSILLRVLLIKDSEDVSVDAAIRCGYGIGFPPDLDFRNTETLGLQLVTALTGQLEGKSKVPGN